MNESEFDFLVCMQILKFGRGRIRFCMLTIQIRVDACMSEPRRMRGHAADAVGFESQTFRRLLTGNGPLELHQLLSIVTQDP